MVVYNGVSVFTNKEVAEKCDVNHKKILHILERYKSSLVAGVDYYKLDGRELVEFKKIAKTQDRFLRINGIVFYVWTECGVEKIKNILVGSLIKEPSGKTVEEKYADLLSSAVGFKCVIRWDSNGMFRAEPRKINENSFIPDTWRKTPLDAAHEYLTVFWERSFKKRSFRKRIKRL